MKFKDGDKLYCHTSEKEVVAGLYYTILDIGGAPILYINNKILGFDPENYQKNFYTPKELRELRKMKLKKLENET